MDYNNSSIQTLDDLKREKFAVRQRLKMREQMLRRKLYEIPAELAAAGANSVIPNFLKGKVTDKALEGGKKLINKFFVPEEKVKIGLPGIVRNVGLFKKVLSLFKK